jgi:streptogramin lyase
MHAARIALVTAILVIVLISSGSLTSPPVAAAPPQNSTLLEWSVPSSSAKLGGISVDNSGRVWFTENGTSKLAMLDPLASKVFEWGISANSRNVVTRTGVGAYGGSSNRVYFAEFGSNQIGFFDNVTGFMNYVTEMGSLTGSQPASVAVDSQGNIWFTESGGGGYIGEFTSITTPTSGSPTAQLIEWQLPGWHHPPSESASNPASLQNAPCSCAPWGIYVNQTSPTSFVSPDTYVWFTEKTGGTKGYGAIGRLQKSTNILTLWDLGANPLGSNVYGPNDIALDSSGNAYWVDSANTNSISILGSNLNTYREIPLTTTTAVPVAPTPDPARKALWSLEYAGNNLAYLDLTAFQNSRLTPTAMQCTFLPTTPTSHAPTQCPGPNGQTSKSVTGSSRSLGKPTVTGVAATNSGTLGTPTGPVNGFYEYALLSASAAPFAMFLDANENLWITESSNTVNKIAEVQFPGDFGLQLTSSSSQTVSQGGSATYSISVSPTSGQQSPVTLSVNVPAGVTSSFDTVTGTPPFTSTLTLSTTGSTTPSTYPMTITAQSSDIPPTTHSLSISLTVTTQIVTSTTSSSTTGSYSCGFDYQITADQTSQAIQEGSLGTYQLHVLQTCPTVSQLPVTLTLTTPTGVTGQFTNNGLAPQYDTQLQVQVAVDAPVTQTGTITVSGTSPGGPSHSLTLTIQIAAAVNDFSISGAPGVSLIEGSRADITLTVTSIGLFTGPVAFTIANPPVSGGGALSGSVSPNPINLAPGAVVITTLEIAVQKITSGSYVLTVTGTGSTPQGPVSHDFKVNVAVTSGLPCLIATATFGSPLAPEVQFLRDFRNQQILHTFAGSNFMVVFNAWYYSFSPAVAGYENMHPAVKSPMQYFLTPLLGSLHVSSWTYASIAVINPEIAALVAGLVASSLIGLLYIALPLATAVWFLRRKVLAREGNVRGRLVRFFAASFGVMILLFAISELLALATTMMIASAAIVLLGLAAGCTIPIFAVIDRLYEH